MIRSYILIWLLFQLSKSHSQSFYFEDGDTLTVISKSGANLRDSNSISAAKIVSIPFGEKVLGRTTKCCIYFERDTFDNRYGSWISVEYNGRKGYIFSGFVTKLKIPSINFESIDCYDSGLFEKIIRENADSLICKGSRLYKGFDEDGKDCGYFGSNDASHFGSIVPVIPVQMVPVFTVLFVPVFTVQTVPL